MDLARVSANGQITVPVEIRRKLGLNKGDKLLFFERPNGDIVVGNASDSALRTSQQAFAGIFERLGSPSDEEIQSWVNEVRYNKAIQ